MSLIQSMIKQSLAIGLLKGTLRYGNSRIECNHSPIATDRVLQMGGFGRGAECKIIVLRANLPSKKFRFEQNTDMELEAADGNRYAMRIAEHGMEEGYPDFIQFTANDISGL